MVEVTKGRNSFRICFGSRGLEVEIMVGSAVKREKEKSRIISMFIT